MHRRKFVVGEGLLFPGSPRLTFQDGKEIGEDDDAKVDPDVCPTCGADIEATLNGDTTVHYAGPNSTRIVAWTCSEACALQFEVALGR